MDSCEKCNKIKCLGCGWEPNDEEVSLIQQGIFTACPVCNWQPSQNLDTIKE